MKPYKRHSVIYSRMDIGENHDPNLTDEQIDVCRTHCSINGLVVRREFLDYGSSHNLKEIDSLFHYILNEPSIEVIVVATKERILGATNARKLYKYANQLGDSYRDIEILAISEKDSPMSLAEFKKILFWTINSSEKLIMDEKRLISLKNYSLGGGWIGALPVGYKRVTTCQSRITDTDELKLISKAFEMKLIKTSDREILKFLNRNGVPVNIDALRRIFKNIFYTGYLRSKLTGGALVKGKYDGIITLEEFERIQGFYKRRISTTQD